MADVLLVDDREATARMYEGWLTKLGHAVDVVIEPPLVTPEYLAARAPDLAVIDMNYAAYDMSGLDVLLLLYRHVPACRLVVLTNGDPAVGDMLRISWEALPVVAALSKGTLFPDFERAIVDALAGKDFIDADLQAWLPKERDRARSIDQFRGLIGHAGHARLLLSLCEHADPPSQGEIAQSNGWVVATVRNYTDHITQRLEIFGFGKMGYAELYSFVQAARAIVREVASSHLEQSENGDR